jgi:hypothetical protein
MGGEVIQMRLRASSTISEKILITKDRIIGQGRREHRKEFSEENCCPEHLLRASIQWWYHWWRFTSHLGEERVSLARLTTEPSSECEQVCLLRIVVAFRVRLTSWRILGWNENNPNFISSASDVSGAAYFVWTRGFPENCRSQNWLQLLTKLAMSDNFSENLISFEYDSLLVAALSLEMDSPQRVATEPEASFLIWVTLVYVGCKSRVWTSQKWAMSWQAILCSSQTVHNIVNPFALGWWENLSSMVPIKSVDDRFAWQARVWKKTSIQFHRCLFGFKFQARSTRILRNGILISNWIMTAS